jgi:hypothetical protein
MPLLYVGISPKRPPQNGARSSTQTLRSRLRYHYRGNAEGSTLRLTLGCLLAESLEISLYRVGSGKRLTFADGENRLNEWLEANAFVTWIACGNAWDIEHGLLKTLDLPLNLDQNRSNSFYATLAEIRKAAKHRAQNSPIWHEVPD